ncbi:RNA methyltransferase [Moraxella macacae 0408225]|uniref:RNA methyltransferase n=1 Tax=Moraxella macacae 0408225 TaxID=1230338 RepID=L2F8K2_9GAMM|nr:23S rRNA (guanosine(2251)-2'-O)-methyltransferase RlmB [Moraxella macacae]ELA09230.1 RNA methyltransferase [Moraxella macacae 0408225]
MSKPVYYYGIHAVSAILEQRGIDALNLFIQDNKQGNKQGDKTDKAVQKILELAKGYGISVQFSAKDKLSKLANSLHHQGVVLQARPAKVADETDLKQLIEQFYQQNKPILLLVLDQITDPNNLGACLRTAAAMGVSAVIVPKNHSSNLTAVVAKVAVGATELMTFIQVTNLARTLNDIKKQGVFVYGTALDNSAKSVQEVDLTGNVAIVMGSEGDGIRRLTADTCDKLVYIPMIENERGAIQSLNVSVATGMVLYEANRQRRMGL